METKDIPASGSTEDSLPWLSSVEETFSRLSGAFVPEERATLFDAALVVLERESRGARLSGKRASSFVQLAMEAFKQSELVLSRCSVLAKVLKRARRHAEFHGDKRSTAILDLQLGRVLLLLNKLKESDAACTRGLAAIDVLGDKDFAEYAGRFLIMYHTIHGEPLRAIETYKNIRTSLDGDADPFVLTHIMPTVALNASFVGQFKLAKQLLMNAYRRAQTIGHFAGERSLETTLGLVLVAAGDLEQARPHINAPVESDHGSYFPIWAFWTARNKAYLLYVEGDVAGSYEEMRQARLKADRTGLQSGFYITPWMFEMLWAFHSAGYAPIPGFEYEKEVQRIVKGGNLHLKGTAYRLLSRDAGTKNASVDTQMRLLRKSESLLLEVSAEIELAKTWIDMGRLHLRHGADHLAGPVIAKAWQIFERTAPSLFPEDLRHLLQPSPVLPEEESFWPIYDALMDLLTKLPVPLSRADLHFRMVSIACSFFGAERGGLFVSDPSSGRWKLECGLNLPGATKGAHEKHLLDFVEETMQKEEPVLISGGRQRGRDFPTMLCIRLSTGESKRLLFVETAGGMDIFCSLGPQQIRQLCVHVGRQLSMLINMLETMEDAHRLNLGQATRGGNSPDNNLIFVSDSMSRVMRLADMAARSDASVLILGETGVGKELMALHIHRQSPRHNMPFVAVDLSSVPESLVESELFGHERGAFTGANERKVGQVELADKGTLFIDEIGDISPAVQVKLLRLLQEKSYRRVGGAKLLHSDFRLIVATNKDLKSAVEAGRFRDDLYYRLNVISVAIPPLRDRIDDVPCLTEHFLAYFCRKYRKPALALTTEMERLLREYGWPGNVRELKNIIERIVVLQDDNFPMVAPQEVAPSSNVLYARHPDRLPTLDELQASYISDVLRRTGGKIAGKSGAAAILGLKRTTLYRKLRKLSVCDSRWSTDGDSPK